MCKYNPGWDVAESFRANENPQLAAEAFFYKFFEREEKK